MRGGTVWTSWLGCNSRFLFQASGFREALRTPANDEPPKPESLELANLIRRV